MSTRVAVVLGVGPGLGRAVAVRFAREGFAVALMARQIETLEPVHREIEENGGRAVSIVADATDPASVDAAFERVKETLGATDVFIYNAGAFKMGGIESIEPAEFDACWRANCAGAFYAARHVLGDMVHRGRGTILLTGATASLRGSANFACLAVGKFGLRALGQSMAREFGPKGVHVAHVVIDGQIETPRARAMFPGRESQTFLSPDSIADTYFQLHCQDRTTWTLELDLRPSIERF